MFSLALTIRNIDWIDKDTSLHLAYKMVVSGKYVNMKEEKQHMEDFINDLFLKNKDFNLLIKKIVEKYQ